MLQAIDRALRLPYLTSYPNSSHSSSCRTACPPPVIRSSRCLSSPDRCSVLHPTVDKAHPARTRGRRGGSILSSAHDFHLSAAGEPRVPSKRNRARTAISASGYPPYLRKVSQDSSQCPRGSLFESSPGGLLSPHVFVAEVSSEVHHLALS